MPDLQAARGASLSTSETSAVPPEPASGPNRGRSASVLALAVGAVGLALDVVSKQLAVNRLDPGGSVSVVGDLLQLRLLLNPGAAFSAGASFTVAISVVAIVAAVVISAYVVRVRHRGWAVALGLMLAGVLGNLADRLFRPPGPMRGHVVDFFELPNWPVFNVADICINAAAVLAVVLLVRGVRMDGSRHDG